MVMETLYTTVRVVDHPCQSPMTATSPTTLANYPQLFVFCNDELGTAVLVARLDNLGKVSRHKAMQL